VKNHNFEFFNNLPYSGASGSSLSAHSTHPVLFATSTFFLLHPKPPPDPGSLYRRPPTHSARPSTLTSSALTGYDS